MRPITLISALVVSLQLLSGSARADSGGGAWTWPIRGPVLTEYRNGSDPYAAGQHRGIDIAGPVGTRVVAATAGTVTFAGVAGSSGLTVAERTADGRLDLSYLHLASTPVHRGDPIAAGTPLGAVGTSGRRSAEAPHLHFGVREAGSHTAYRNPLDFLPAPPAVRSPDPEPTPVPVTSPAEPRPAPAPAVPAPGAPAPATAPVTPGLAAAHGAPAPATAPGTPGLAAAHGAPRTAHGQSPADAPGIGPEAPAFADAIPGAKVLAPLLDPPRHRVGDASPTHTSGLPATQADASAHGSRATSQAAHGPAMDPHGAGAAPAGHRPADHPHRHGIDIGWLLACIGLVAAATALGHPDGTRRLTTRGRARFAAMRAAGFAVPRVARSALPRAARLPALRPARHRPRQ